MMLKHRFETICDEYLHEFCRRHELHFEDADWVVIGELVQIADYFFSFSDIRYDVDHEIAENTIFEWYDYDMEIHDLRMRAELLEKKTEIRGINYPSWCDGAPRPYTPKEMAKMAERLSLREKAKRKITNFVSNNIKSVK